MQEIKETFISALNDYNDKRFELSKAKRYKKIAENDYNEIYEIARANYDGITPESIETAKSFDKFEEELDPLTKKLGQNISSLDSQN